MLVSNQFERQIRFNVGPQAGLALNPERPTNAFYPLAHPLQSETLIALFATVRVKARSEI